MAEGKIFKSIILKYNNNNLNTLILFIGKRWKIKNINFNYIKMLLRFDKFMSIVRKGKRQKI